MKKSLFPVDLSLPPLYLSIVDYTKISSRRFTMFSPKEILVPLDLKGDPGKLLREAVTISEKYGSKLHLLHVEDEIQQCAVDYCIDYEQLEAVREKVAKAAREKLAGEMGKITKRKDVDINVRFGDTVEQILNEEKEKNIDLILVEPHAARGIGSMFKKGTTEKLVHSAHAETLMVH
jgi:nucleotide-binding universal stress UspA family protein